MAASGHQATPSAAGQAASCRDPRGRPGRGLSLQSRPLPSAPPASPENAILQENVGQEPTPTRLWWPRTHNHADLQSPPGARDGPAGTPVLCGLLGQTAGAVSEWAGQRGCPLTQHLDSRLRV